MKSSMEKIPSSAPPNPLTVGTHQPGPPPPYQMLQYEAPRPRPRPSWMNYRLFLVLITLVAAVVICTCIFVAVYVATSHHHSKPEVDPKPTHPSSGSPHHPVWNFRLNATYQGIRFIESIRMDQGERLMSVDVPVSTVTNQSVTLHDFAAGYLAAKSEYWRRCLIQHIRVDFDDIVKELKDTVHRNRTLEIQCSLSAIGQPVDTERLASLGRHITQHCHGYKTFWMTRWGEGDRRCTGRCWGMGFGRHCYSPY